MYQTQFDEDRHIFLPMITGSDNRSRSLLGPLSTTLRASFCQWIMSHDLRESKEFSSVQTRVKFVTLLASHRLQNYRYSDS